MRLDVYLNAVCVLKSRSMAKEACDRDKILVNGVPAKASRLVRAGDRIRLELGPRVLELEVTGIPPGPISRKQAPGYYKILEDQRS